MNNLSDLCDILISPFTMFFEDVFHNEILTPRFKQLNNWDRAENLSHHNNHD